MLLLLAPRTGRPNVVLPDPPPPDPGPPPVESTNFLRLADTLPDAPYWTLSNGAFASAWNNAGGDWMDSTEAAQGSNAYSSFLFQATHVAEAEIQFTVTALATRWLASGNTGMHLRKINGTDISFYGRTHPEVTKRPLLTVITNTGTFICQCLASVSIAIGAGFPVSALIQPTCLLRFDLTAVQGTVQSATLSLRVQNVFSGGFPRQLHVNRLHVPFIITNVVTEVGGVVLGIADQVAQDTDLASHPSIIKYDDLDSDAKFVGAARRFVTVNLGLGGHSYIPEPLYNLSLLRVLSAPSPTIFDAHAWSQNESSVPQPFASWKKPYTHGQQLGYTHVFFRHLFRIGTDVKVGMTELGIKFSGLSGAYIWSSSGAPTQPEPFDDGTFDYRLWYSQKSLQHPGCYRLAIYAYDADWPIAVHSGVGDVRYADFIPNAIICLEEGQLNSIEFEVKLNTLNGLIANPDGENRIWLNGVKVYERTNVRTRKYPEVNIHTIPYLTVYHGGLGIPSSTITHDLGAVAISSVYIGPPKTTLPAWVPPPGTFAEFTLNAPYDTVPSTGPGVFENWTSAAMIQDFSVRGAVAYHGGGEHPRYMDSNAGVTLLDMDTRLYTKVLLPWKWPVKQIDGFAAVLALPGQAADSGDFDHGNNFGEYEDGSTDSPHTYQCAVEGRASWIDGMPKGFYIRAGNSAGGSTSLSIAQTAANGGYLSPAGNAYASVHIYDISKPNASTVTVDGSNRVTSVTNRNIRRIAPLDGAAPLPLGGQTLPSDQHSWGNYGGACGDELREGVWMQGGASSSRTVFTRIRDGVSFWSPGSIGTPGGPFLHHFYNDGQDVLLMCWANNMWVLNLAATSAPGNLPNPATPTVWPGTNWQWQARMSMSDNAVNTQWYTGLSPISGPPGPTRLSYYVGNNIGCWNPIMGCFNGMNPSVPGCELFHLRPSDPTNLMTSTWEHEIEVIASYDGSTVEGGAKSNEILKKLILCPSLRSLVWSNGRESRGQLVRPLGMA